MIGRRDQQQPNHVILRSKYSNRSSGLIGKVLELFINTEGDAVTQRQAISRIS
jgi:hypothetical protein